MDSSRTNRFRNTKRSSGRRTSTPIPKLNEPFEMEVDASAIAIGAVLNQKGEDNKMHPVTYYSESFSATE